MVCHRSLNRELGADITPTNIKTYNENDHLDHKRPVSFGINRERSVEAW